MTPAEILERAADVIDERGHWRGKLRLNRECAVSSMWIVVKGTVERSRDELTAAHLALRKVVGEIPRWNDANKKDTVTSTMRAVAATLRASDETPTRNDGGSVETQTVSKPEEANV